MTLVEALQCPRVQRKLRRNVITKPAKIMAAIAGHKRRGRMLDVYAALGARDAVARDLYPKPPRDES